MIQTNNYEAALVLDPGLSEEAIEAIVARLGKILTNAGAQIMETAHWGRRRLAYPIGKHTDGYYLIFFFTLDNAEKALDEFERQCRLSEDILRVLTVKVPTKKRGQEVAQLVPTPGYLSNFQVETREEALRRRMQDRRSRYEQRSSGAAGPSGASPEPKKSEPVEPAGSEAAGEPEATADGGACVDEAKPSAEPGAAAGGADETTT